MFGGAESQPETSCDSGKTSEKDKGKGGYKSPINILMAIT